MLRYTYNLAAMLVLMQAIVFAITNLYLPSLPYIKEYFGVTKVQVQFTVSMYFLGLFVFAATSDLIIKKFGEIRTLIYGTIIFIISSIFSIFSEDIMWLKVGLFLIALSVGPMAIISRAFLGNIEKKDRRVAISMVYLMASLLSSMVAPLIGGFISFFLWWQCVFVICIVLGIIIFYRIRIFQKNNNAYKSQVVNTGFGGYITILSNKTFCLLSGIKWTLYAASQAFYIEIPFILHHHGFNASDIGIVILITGTGFIFGSFLSRLFAKSLEVSRVIITSLIIAIIGGAICAYQMFIYDIYVFVFAAWVMMTGIGMSASNLMMIVLDNIPQDLHTKMSALYNMINLFMFFVVTSVIGHIANYSMEVFYSLFLILPLISMILFLVSKVFGLFRNI